MGSRRAFLLIALAATFAMVAAACGDDADTTVPTSPQGQATTTSAPDDDPAGDGCTTERVGGSLTIATYSQPGGLDPVVGSGTGLSTGKVGGTEGAAMYDLLVLYDHQTGEYTPHLAESISADDDNTRWTLRLRPGISFDNGDPFDAEAVRTSILRHVAEGSRSTLRRGLALVEEYEVVDDLTLVFHLSAPWGNFPMLLAGPPGMITNQAVVDDRGDDFNLNPAGAGVGPFLLERFVPGEEIVMRARDDYWGGPVCVEELRFTVIGGGPQTLEWLMARQIDVGFLPDASSIVEARQAGYDGLHWILHSGSMVLMNNGVGESEAVTADLRVRRAVAYALDPDFINLRQFDGQGLATSALVHHDSPLFPGVDGPPHDPDLARALVEEVMGETGWDGSIRLLCNDLPDRRDAALAIETLLNAVGMEVVTTIGDTSQLIAGVVTAQDYDLACWAAQFTEADVWFNLSIFSSDSLTNYSGIDDAQMDAALGELRAARTLEERRQALASLQQRWNEIVPSASFGAAQTYIVFSEHVHGLTQSIRETYLFHDAYVE